MNIINFVFNFFLFIDEIATFLSMCHLQSVECNGTLRTISDYFTNLYGSGDEENYDSEKTAVYKDHLTFIHEKLSSYKTVPQMYRPSLSTYSALVQDAHDMLQKIVSNAGNFLEKYLAREGEVELKKELDFARILFQWISSLATLSREIELRYAAYRDMIGPFSTGVHQVIYGFKKLHTSYRKELFLSERKLVASGFGGIVSGFDPLLAIYGINSVDFFGAAESLWKNRSEVLRLLKLPAEETLAIEVRFILYILNLLKQHVAVVVQGNREFHRLIDVVFCRVSAIWMDIEQARKKVTEQKEQLYKFTKSAEERVAREMFPMFQDAFGEEEMTDAKSLNERNLAFFTEEMEAELVAMHRFLTIGKADNGFDFWQVVASGSVVYGRIFTACATFLDLPINSPTILFQTDEAIAELSGSLQKNSGDFYRGSNLLEVKKCLPVLRSVRRKADDLLVRFPSHPVMMEVLVVIDRLLSFSVADPVAKFLSGVELLLDKCERSDVKIHLKDEMLLLSELIVEWRKLELREWRRSLDSVYERRRSTTGKWWSLLFSMLHDFLSGTENVDETADVLVVSLQKLMESATLGEYGSRLELLLIMGNHFEIVLVRKGGAVRTKSICDVLRNVHSFYGQFVVQVEEVLRVKRKKIEDDLKGFIEPARWKHMNYHSLKSIVDKSHQRVLEKMRQFEVG